MTTLNTIRCVGCEGGIPALTPAEIKDFITQVKDWKVSDDNLSIQKKYQFKNFYHTMAFVNAIAYIANQEGHHPDLAVDTDFCFRCVST